MKTELVDRTRELLQKRPHDVTYAHIQRETDLKESWLRAFSQGTNSQPNAVFIQTLYDFLSETPLKVN